MLTNIEGRTDLPLARIAGCVRAIGQQRRIGARRSMCGLLAGIEPDTERSQTIDDGPSAGGGLPQSPLFLLASTHVNDPVAGSEVYGPIIALGPTDTGSVAVDAVLTLDG